MLISFLFYMSSDIGIYLISANMNNVPVQIHIFSLQTQNLARTHCVKGLYCDEGPVFHPCYLR